MADITLTSASRSNLLSLQNTADLVKRTQGRLSTGKAVASVTDDALKYFTAKSLSDRAGDLNARKDAIDQGISSLKTATTAIDSIEKLMNQVKGVINSSRSASQSQRAEYTSQLGSLLKQVQKLVEDASYSGQNLVNSSASKLSVTFSDKTDSKLEVNGVDFNSSGALFKASDGTAGAQLAAATLSSAATSAMSALGFSYAGFSVPSLSDAAVLATFNEQADIAIARLDATISNLRAKSSVFGNSVAILQVRLDFTKSYTNLLNEGSDKLTLADLNEEGANLLALQTRQQLGIQSLSFAGQSEQAVLGLFR